MYYLSALSAIICSYSIYLSTTGLTYCLLEVLSRLSMGPGQYLRIINSTVLEPLLLKVHVHTNRVCTFVCALGVHFCPHGPQTGSGPWAGGGAGGPGNTLKTISIPQKRHSICNDILIQTCNINSFAPDLNVLAPVMWCCSRACRGPGARIHASISLHGDGFSSCSV